MWEGEREGEDISKQQNKSHIKTKKNKNEQIEGGVRSLNCSIYSFKYGVKSSVGCTIPHINDNNCQPLN